jgi:SOS-response transcriptional repressor LexA
VLGEGDLRGTAMKPIKGNTLRILGAILEARECGEPPPTYRELMEGLGIGSTNGVTWHVRRLQDAGLIEREYGRSRAVKLRCKFLPAENFLAGSGQSRTQRVN